MGKRKAVERASSHTPRASQRSRAGAGRQGSPSRQDNSSGQDSPSGKVTPSRKKNQSPAAPSTPRGGVRQNGAHAGGSEKASGSPWGPNHPDLKGIPLTPRPTDAGSDMMCHQCQRVKPANVSYCNNAAGHRYCASCAGTWYPNLGIRDFVLKCPLCVGNCSCKECLRKDKTAQYPLRKIASDDVMEGLIRVALDFTGRQLDSVLEKEEGELVYERRIKNLEEGSPVDVVHGGLHKHERLVCSHCFQGIHGSYRRCPEHVGYEEGFELCLDCCKALRETGALPPGQVLGLGVMKGDEPEEGAEGEGEGGEKAAGKKVKKRSREEGEEGKSKAKAKGKTRGRGDVPVVDHAPEVVVPKKDDVPEPEEIPRKEDKGPVEPLAYGHGTPLWVAFSDGAIPCPYKECCRTVKVEGGATKTVHTHTLELCTLWERPRHLLKLRNEARALHDVLLQKHKDRLAKEGAAEGAARTQSGNGTGPAAGDEAGPSSSPPPDLKLPPLAEVRAGENPKVCPLCQPAEAAVGRLVVELRAKEQELAECDKGLKALIAAAAAAAGAGANGSQEEEKVAGAGANGGSGLGEKVEEEKARLLSLSKEVGVLRCKMHDAVKSLGGGELLLASQRTAEEGGENCLLFPSVSPDGSLSVEDRAKLEAQYLEHFALHWRMGLPVIVRDTMHFEDAMSWHLPGVIMRGMREPTNRDVDVIDCTDYCEARVSVQDFFKGFEEGMQAADPSGWPLLLKIKDWPSQGEFYKRLARLGADFLRFLPFEMYNNPWFGKLNLFSAIPRGYKRPDLGPKTYAAFGVRREMLFGDCATKVHQDMADAVNLMTTVKEKDLLNKDQKAWIERFRPVFEKALEELDCNVRATKATGGPDSLSVGTNGGVTGVLPASSKQEAGNGEVKREGNGEWERRGGGEVEVEEKPHLPIPVVAKPASGKKSSKRARTSRGGEEKGGLKEEAGGGEGEGDKGGLKEGGEGEGGKGGFKEGGEGERGKGEVKEGGEGDGAKEAVKEGGEGEGDEEAVLEGAKEAFWFVAREGAAQWDIFPRHTVPQLRKFIMENPHRFRHHHNLSLVGKIQDPVHDQSVFLSEGDKRVLKRDYGVEPWTFEQKAGEAVFVPAGCPHQVRNQQSCIKVAIDFVSPESLQACFKLAEEFRVLPDDHTAKEDKLGVGIMLVRWVEMILHEMAEKEEQAEEEEEEEELSQE